MDFSVHKKNEAAEFLKESLKVHFGDSETFAHNVERFTREKKKKKYINESKEWAVMRDYRDKYIWEREFLWHTHVHMNLCER